MEKILEERLTELQRIYYENGKTDYDAGRVQGMREALELIAAAPVYDYVPKYDGE